MMLLLSIPKVKSDTEETGEMANANEITDISQIGDLL